MKTNNMSTVAAFGMWGYGLTNVKAVYEAAKVKAAERRLHKEEVRRRETAERQAKNLPLFVTVFEAAAAAWAVKRTRDAKLTAELMNFVNGGCKALVTKTKEAKFFFDLQRFGQSAADMARLLQRKRDYAKQTLRNELDRRQIKLQSFSIGMTNVMPKVITFGMNKMTRAFYEMAYVFNPVHVAMNGGVSMAYNNVMNTGLANQPFTDELIQLDVAADDKFVAANDAEYIKKNGLRVQYVNGTVRLWTVAKTKGGMIMYTVYEPGETASSESVMAGSDLVELYDKRHEAGSVWKRYAVLYAGPSNQRRVTYFLFKVRDNETLAAAKSRIFMMLNDLAGGVLTTLGDVVEASNTGVSYEKFFKKVSRLSLAFTPSTPNMSAHGFYYFHGALGEGLGDGQWIVNGDQLAAFNGLDPESVYGLGIQARVTQGIIGKGMAIAVSTDDMNSVIAEHGSVSKLTYGEFRKAFIDGKLVAGKMYLVGDDANPSYVFDENTLKMVGTEPTSNRGFQLDILEIRTATSGKLNSQDAACLQHLSGAVEFVRDLGVKYVDEEIAKLNAVFDGEVSDNSPIDPSGFFMTTVTKFCPGYAATNKKLLRSTVENAAKGIVKTVNGLNFPLGYGDEYRYLQSDYAAFFSASAEILRDGEVYMPGKKGGLDIDLTRNPKTDVKENYRAITVGIDEIVDRVNNLKNNDDIKTAIRFAYMHADNCLVIAPPTTKVVDSLGGADFDGDGATCHLNPEYIRIQDQEPVGTCIIPKEAPSGKVVMHFDVDVLQDIMLEGIFGQKDARGKRMMPTPVGIMANHATLIQALKVSDDTVLEHVINDIIRPNVKAMRRYHMTHKDYTCRFDTADVEIHDSDVVNATEEYYTSDLSVKTTRKFLGDATRMGSSVVGRGIDQNKTGNPVSTGYLGVLEAKDISGENIHVRGLLRAKCTDTVDVDVKFSVDDNGIESAETIMQEVGQNVVLVDSLLTPIKFELLNYALDKINGLFKKIDLVEASETEAVLVNSNIGNDIVDMADLKYVKAIHSAIMAQKTMQTEEKNAACDALVRMTSGLFDDTDKAAKRFVQIKKAAGNSAFEFILKDDYLKAVSYMAKNEGWKTNDVVGYPAVVMVDCCLMDGDEILMVNGMSHDGLVVADKKVSGYWKLSYLNGKAWLTKAAVDFFSEEKHGSDDLALELKTFNGNKAEGKWNRIPEVKGCSSAIICNENRNSSLVFAEDHIESLNMPRAYSNGHLELVKSRLNRKVAGKRINISMAIQVAYKEYVNTFVVGRLVETNKQPTTGVTVSMEEVNNIF